MSKLTTEEMLDMLEAFHQQWQGTDTHPEKWDKEGVRFRDAIRSLIESSDKGPEVDREWIEKWAQRLKNDIDRPENYNKSIRFTMDNLCEMLREAGVKIKEEK